MKKEPIEAMIFPIERHPGEIIFVDDDENYLSVMQGVLPDTWNSLTFSNAPAFLEHMSSKIAISNEMESFQRGAIERCRQGSSAATEVIRYWNSFPERYSLPAVVVVDSNMHDLNGLDALAQLKGWNGHSILLTGVAEEARVCRAFNEKVIDFYIAKQSARILKQIVTTVNEMITSSFKRLLKWDAWHLSLSVEQMFTLQTPDLKKYLFNFLNDNFEHIVLGDPFGVMALGYDGTAKWLQFETTSTLITAASLALKSGATTEEVLNVRIGRTLTDARINHALLIDKKATVSESKFEIRLPHGSQVLYGATFDIHASAGVPSPAMCYSAWQTRNQQR